MTNANRNSNTRFPIQPDAAANAVGLNPPDRLGLGRGSRDLATQMDQELDEQEWFAVAAEPNFSGIRW